MNNIIQYTNTHNNVNIIIGCWDEELKIIMMIAQNDGNYLVDANGRCALNNAVLILFG